MKKWTIDYPISLQYSLLLFSIYVFLICNTGCKLAPRQITTQPADPWSEEDTILMNISPPVFPDKTFNILDFGADPTGDRNSLPALAEAINRCSEAGGGKVSIPAGQYFLEGPIYLKSNVNLHLDHDAEVNFSTDPTHYLPVVRTRWEGVECFNYSPLIYAFEEENIAITGSGELNGQANSDNWWKWANNKEYGWEEGLPSQSDSLSRPLLYKWNTYEVAVSERKLGAGAYLRPNFIQPNRCTNVLIDSITIKNSPMWVMHPLLCENVTVKNVTVISHGPNSDGCDPESCKNVLIENCYFDTGDDCIALKSGRNQDGRNSGKPIENVIIRNCIMRDGHGGVVIGSEVSGGARNIFARNCKMDSPNLDRAIRVKTNKIRGGTIENLFFKDIEVGEVKEAVVRINMHYPIYSNPNQEFIPEINNIYIKNVTSQKSKYGILIDGYSETHPVRGLHIQNCRFNGVESGNDIEYVQDISFDELYINNELVKS